MTSVRDQEQALSLGATFVDTGVDARQGRYARALTPEEKTKVDAADQAHPGLGPDHHDGAIRQARQSLSARNRCGMKPGAVIVDLPPKAAAIAKTPSG